MVGVTNEENAEEQVIRSLLAKSAIMIIIVKQNLLAVSKGLQGDIKSKISHNS